MPLFSFLLSAADSTDKLINNGDIQIPSYNDSSALNNNGNLYIQVFFYVAIIALIAIALIFLRKFLLSRAGTLKSGSYMRIADRIPIASDKQIILIEFKNKVIVAGVTSQRIESLSEFDRSELQEFDSSDSNSFKDSKFLEMINMKINKSTKKNPPGNSRDFGNDV